MVNIWVNIINYFSPLKFFKIYMTVKAKTVTLSGGVCRVHSNNTYDN